MMERYLKEHVSKMLSVKAYQGYIRNLIPFFGEYSLLEITPRLINEYKTKRREDGVKPATINRELATMKNASNLAIKEWEWGKENPVAKVSMEKENNKRDRWLTYGDEERLLQVCPEWLREIVIFALNTGMGLGKILSLTWKGVDLFRKTVTVLRYLSQKTMRDGQLPLTKPALSCLRLKQR